MTWKNGQKDIETLLDDSDKERKEYVNLFNLGHKDLIDAKLRARKKLS